MIKKNNKEIFYLWDRKDLKEKKQHTKIIVEANRKHRNELAKRIGVTKVKSFKTNFEIIKIEKNVIKLNGHISSEIECLDPNTGDISEIYVDENFEEQIQFCSSIEQELNPIIEDRLITERFDRDLIDLGEIAAQNLCLAVDTTGISAWNEDYHKDRSISVSNTSSEHRPFSELGALLEMQTASKKKS